MEVFEFDDVINYILLTLRMLCEGCYRFYIVFRAFSCVGRKRFEYATCGRIRTKFSVFKNIQIHVGGALDVLVFTSIVILDW